MSLRRTLEIIRQRPLRACSVGLFWGTAGAIAFNDHLLELTDVQGVSMAPTLSPTYHETKDRDYVLWNKWISSSKIQRGDVVHFMNPYKPDGFAVKRVIAVGGDTVILDPRRRPEVTGGREVRETKAWDALKGEVSIPLGLMWVEGDNARASKDSNWYGPISMSLVDGTAIAVVTPSKFWTKPWEGYRSRTKVIEGGGKLRKWQDTLPAELAEIGEPHLPR